MTGGQRVLLSFIWLSVHFMGTDIWASLSSTDKHSKLINTLELPLLRLCKKETTAIELMDTNGKAIIFQSAIPDWIQVDRALNSLSSDKVIDRLSYQNYHKFLQMGKLQSNPSREKNGPKILFVAFLNPKTSTIRRLVYLNSNQYSRHEKFIKSLSGYKNHSLSKIFHMGQTARNKNFYFGWVSPHSFNPELLVKRFGVLSQEPVASKRLLDLHNHLVETIDRSLLKKLVYVPTTGSFGQRMSRLIDRGFSLEIKTPRADRDVKIYTPNTWAIGRVMRINRLEEYKRALAHNQIRRNTILVLKVLPKEIPPVAAIIISKPMSHLGHWLSLCKQLKIPLLYSRDAYQSPKWKKLSRSIVYLQTWNDGYKVFSITNQTHELLSSLKLRPPLSPAILLNERFNKSVNLNKITTREFPKFGARATYQAEMLRALKYSQNFQGFAIPFFHYRNFINQPHSNGKKPRKFNNKSLGEYILTSLDRIAENNVPFDVVTRTLSHIRRRIINTPLEDRIWLDKIFNKINREYFTVGIKSISLYPSINIIGEGGLISQDRNSFNQFDANQNVGQLETLIKMAWASLYTPASYWVRKEKNIRAKQIAVAILFQPNKEVPLAQGQAVIMPDNDLPKDLFVRALAVPNPNFDFTALHKPSDSPEITQTHLTWEEDLLFDLRHPTSIQPWNSGTPVLLSSQAYKNMFYQMEQVYNWWQGKMDNSPQLQLHFDWKWSLDKNGLGEINLYQVKPYNLGQTRSSQKSDPLLVIMPNERVSIKSQRSDFPDALLSLVTEFEMEWTPKSFYLGEKTDFAASFSKIMLKWRSGKLESIAVNSDQIQFESKSYKRQEGKTVRKLSVLLSTVKIPSLKLTLTHTSSETTANQEQKKNTNEGLRMLSLKDFDISFSAATNDLLPLKNYPRCSLSGQPLHSLTWTGIFNYGRDLQPKDSSTYRAEAIGLNSDFKLYVKSHRSAIEAKAPGYEDRSQTISQVLISGLTSSNWSSNRSGAAQYYPIYHDLEWQYAFDLKQFEVNLKPSTMKDIKSAGGQYLVLDSGALDPFSEDGLRPMNLQIWSKAGRLVDYIPLNRDHWSPTN